MPATDYLPRHLAHAFSRLGKAGEGIKGIIALSGNPEYVSYWDDFLGTRGGTWPASTPYAATVGTGTEVIGITQARNGTMTLTTGATDGNTAGQGFGLNWSGDDGFYFIARVMVDRIMACKFEVGMSDAVNDDGAVLDKSATPPTFTATDCGLFCYDTTDNTLLTFMSNGGTTDGDADAVTSLGSFTVTLASPGVFTKTDHGLSAQEPVVFATTGALPTGLTAGTIYYVIAAGLTANNFRVSATAPSVSGGDGAAVNTSVSQSGIHTMTKATPVRANEYMLVEVVGRGPTDTTGDTVLGFLNGQLVGSGNITGATALTPWFYCETLASADLPLTTMRLTVDYWGCIGPRTPGWGGAV